MCPKGDDMNISGLSTNALLLLYNAVREALEIDDNLPRGVEKTYNVREFRDFREWSNGLEAELDNRGARYSKIEWSQEGR